MYKSCWTSICNLLFPNFLSCNIPFVPCWTLPNYHLLATSKSVVSLKSRKCVKCICTCHWLHSACSLSYHPAQLFADALLQHLSESAAPQQLELQWKEHKYISFTCFFLMCRCWDFCRHWCCASLSLAHHLPCREILAGYCVSFQTESPHKSSTEHKVYTREDSIPPNSECR